MKENFALRLKRIMNENNIKASELSDKTKISKSQISHWLSGDYKAKQDNLTVLAEFFDIDEAWLMGFDVPRKKTNTDSILKEKIETLNENQKKAIIQIIDNMK